MASALALSGAAGALFGGAMRISGLYDPELIIAQMRLTKFTMIETFLFATASSSLVLYAFGRIGNSKTPPRAKTSLGSRWSYDGNVVGGLIQGVGMAISGSCPGMIIVQNAEKLPGAPSILAGALLGGIAYTGRARLISSKPVVQLPDRKASLWQLLDISPLAAEVLFQVICVSVATAASYAGPYPPSTPVLPIYGGIAVGFAQLGSLLLTGNTLGVSGAYEEFGRLFWWSVDKTVSGKDLPRPPFRNIMFASGCFVGSLALSRSGLFPASLAPISVSTFTGFLGGFLVVFGSRLSQGCPSGHGISGVGGLSTASIVTIASMFAGGILTSFFL